MKLNLIKQVLNLLFISNRCSINTSIFLLITTILIPLDFGSLWMISKFTKVISEISNSNSIEYELINLFGISIYSLNSFGSILLFILGLSFILKYLQFVFAQYISSKIDSILSINSFERILKIRFSTEDDANTSKYLSDLRSLCDVKSGLILPILQLFYSFVSAIVIIIGLLYLSNSFVLLFGLLLLLIYILITILSIPKLSKISNDLKIKFRKIYTLPMYVIRDLVNIRLYDQEKFYVKSFSKDYSELKKLDTIRSIISQSPKLILEWIILSSFIFIALIISSAGDSTNIISSFSVYLYSLLKLFPSFQLAYVSYTYLSTNAFLLKSIKRFDNIKSFQQEIVYKKDNYNNFKSNERNNKLLSLVINSFSKSFSNNKKIFSQFNLILPSNGIYQFIGESGCGKSTLMKCIAGLDFEYEGSITIVKDKNDLYLNQFSTEPSYWHTFISYVPQNITLKNDTILSNIVFRNNLNKLTAKEKIKLEDALKKAYLYDYIKSLPNGLATEVTQYGGSLSGGQIQRIALARAFFKNSPILLLDEATSALDPSTEHHVLNVLREYSKNHLILFITHRESSLITNNIININNS